MIEKKLVEKEVEVTTVEKRIVEMFTYEDREYTKDDLIDRLMHQAMLDCDYMLNEHSRANRCLTHWRHVETIFSTGVYKQLYKLIHEKMKLIESLDNDVDKN
jgi:hypothetical protein